MAEASDQSSTQLHLTFVEMLFALAIGQVAIDVGSLVILQMQDSIDLGTSLPAYCHLLLATIVIATSWVGWRNSEVSGSRIGSVFCWDFVELLVDVFLVICYFLLARLAELPTGSSKTIVPDASPETRMIVIVMVAYVVSDLLSCRGGHWSKLKLRVWASGVSLVISCIALRVLPLDSDNRKSVILRDCALLGLVFLFRAMKLQDWGKHTTKSKVWIGILVFFFLVFSILARKAA